jgi:hypothetical protein
VKLAIDKTPPSFQTFDLGGKLNARAVRALAAPPHTLHRRGSSRIDDVFTSRDLHARWSFVTTLRWGCTRFDHRALSAQLMPYVDEFRPPVPPSAHGTPWPRCCRASPAPLPSSPVLSCRRLRPRLPCLCSLRPRPAFVTPPPNFRTHDSFIQDKM